MNVLIRAYECVDTLIFTKVHTPLFPSIPPSQSSSPLLLLPCGPTLIRYRNFRTMTSPTPVQFNCLAVDPAGEVVVAGTLDSFQIYVWSIKTGRLLDILAGHEG